MEKRKSRMGRPPLPASELRNRQVMFRLTEAEFRELEAAAGAEPLSRFVRGVVLRSLARRR